MRSGETGPSKGKGIQLTQIPSDQKPARLTRSRTDRMVGGVAGGMAQYMNLDPAWIRIAWLAALVLGPGFFLYIIAWIGIPEADIGSEVQPVRTQHDSDTGKVLIGGLLILVGGSLLANQYLPWMKDLIVPAALIAVGTGVIIYSVKK